MNEDTNDKKGNSLPAPKTESKTQKIQRKINWTIIKIIAVVFWGYAFLKLFVFDVDILLIRWLFPNATWLIEYRGVFVIAILALLALVMWNRKLLGGLLYIGFFPFIFIFFHIPAWLIRRRAWTLSVAAIAGSISLIRSLRSTIILSGLFVVGTVLVTVGVNGFLLWIGMSFLFLFLVVIYIRAIRGSFRSSLDTFSPQSLDKLWSILSKSFTPNDELKSIDIEMLNESQKNTRIANLQFSVLYNRLCYFLADKLITLRQGQVLAAIAGIKILWLFAATLVVFSLLNLGLYKIEPAQFTVIGSIRWFDFLWYTFQASFINNVSEVAPTGVLARSLFMANGITSGLILLIIVAFFITSVQTTRNSDQIDTLAGKIQAQGKEVEIFVVDVFGLTLTAAIEELVHVQAILADWIVQISPEIEPNLTKLDNQTGQGESQDGSKNQGQVES